MTPPLAGATGQPPRFYKQPGSGMGLGLLMIIVVGAILMFLLPVLFLGIVSRDIEEDFGGAFDEVGGGFEDGDGQLSRARIEETVTITRCRTFDGQLTADGTVFNDALGPREFAITIEFADSSGQLLDGFVDVSVEPGQEAAFTSRSPEFSTGRELDCRVGSVFRFVG